MNVEEMFEIIANSGRETGFADLLRSIGVDPKTDLAGADLQDLDLGGEDFTGADLQGALLARARLQGTNLKLANLRDADLTDVNLTGTNLSMADLTGARFSAETLQDADWGDGVVLEDKFYPDYATYRHNLSLRRQVLPGLPNVPVREELDDWMPLFGKRERQFGESPETGDPDVMRGLDRVVPLDQLDDFRVAEGDPDVRGWEVIASDGQKVGEVDQLLVDTAVMKVRYLDVDIDGGLLGEVGRSRHVLIPIGYARLDQFGDHVVVDALASSDVAGLPEYYRQVITQEFEEHLHQQLGFVHNDSPRMNREFFTPERYDETPATPFEDQSHIGPGSLPEPDLERMVAAKRVGETFVPLDEEAPVEKRVAPKEELVVRKHEVSESDSAEAEVRKGLVGFWNSGDARTRGADLE